MTTSSAHAEPIAVGEIAGKPVALRYSALESEYRALRHGAILVDRGHRTRMTFEGARAAETLTGLVTNDVMALSPGSGLYAAALTPRGKIIADIRVFARETHLLVDIPGRAAAGWTTMVRKYVNPRVVPYVDKSEEIGDIGVFGPHARQTVAAITGLNADALSTLPAYGHLVGSFEERDVLAARVPDLGIEGFELILPADVLTNVWRRAVETGATPAGLDAWEVARIEAGRPEWGIDMDDSTIPQEVNLDELHAISYTKGCYTGQETVARVHFRGHVNRHLRGLSHAGDAPLLRGAQLIDATDKAVGDVRSSALSPRLGGIALAMVRREIEPGATIIARWDGGESVVTVLSLPFGS